MSDKAKPQTQTVRARLPARLLHFWWGFGVGPKGRGPQCRVWAWVPDTDAEGRLPKPYQGFGLFVEIIITAASSVSTSATSTEKLQYYDYDHDLRLRLTTTTTTTTNNNNNNNNNSIIMFTVVVMCKPTLRAKL